MRVLPALLLSLSACFALTAPTRAQIQQEPASAAAELAPAAPPKPIPAGRRQSTPATSYEHAPVPEAPQSLLAAELQRVEHELGVLQAERARYRISGPIALMAAGFGVAIIGGLSALISYGSANRVRHNIEHPDETDCTFCPNEDPVYERRARLAAHDLGIASVIGLGVGAVGSLWLGLRLKHRNAHRSEINSLKGRQRELNKSLHYGVGAARGVLNLTVGGRF